MGENNEKDAFCCAVAALLSYCPVVFASTNTPIANANRQVSLGLGGNDFRFTQPGNYQRTVTGSQFAQQFRFSMQMDFGAVKNLYFSAQYSHAKGSTRYDGSTSSGGTDGAKFDDLSLKVGKGFLRDGGSIQLTPYVQYQYHKWSDRVSSDQQDFKHGALGVGVMVQQVTHKGLVITGNVGWAAMFDASMNDSADSSSFNLGKKSVWGLGLEADYAFQRHVHAYVGYQVSHFDYGRSNNVNTGGGYAYTWVPASHTAQQALFAGVGYAF